MPQSQSPVPAHAVRGMVRTSTNTLITSMDTFQHSVFDFKLFNWVLKVEDIPHSLMLSIYVQKGLCYGFKPPIRILI